MEAVNYLNTISASLIGLMAVGGGFSCGYQALKWIQSDDEFGVAKAKKNIKKIIIGVVLGITVTGLINYIFRII